MRLARPALTLLVALSGGAACTPRPPAQPGLARVVLDTDTNNELDDQHALAYLLFNADRWNVLGVTTNDTANGGGIAGQTAEAERVVRLCGAERRVRVYSGAAGRFEEIRPHLGEASYDAKEAVDFLVAQARASSEQDKLVVLAVGKLTNVALALAADPSIAPRMRVIWLGGNWPDRGEYNFDNDPPSAGFVVDAPVALDVVTVRYGKPTGTAAVTVSVDEIRKRMPGLGPHVSPPVTGRHGGSFSSFGDYSLNLFEHSGDRERALFDMAAVAVFKNPSWARWSAVPAPRVEGNGWVERPQNPHTIRFVTDFDRAAITGDFYATMERAK